MTGPDEQDDLARQRLADLGLGRPAWVPDQPALRPESVLRPEPASWAASTPDPPPAAARAGLTGPAALAARWHDLDLAASGRALAGVAAVCGVLLLVTAWALLRSPGSPAPPVAAPMSPLPMTALPAPTPSGIVVDVGGRVRRPGLVTLPPGARVSDAVRAAGGAMRPRDLALVNLAARVSDGQLLLIGVAGADVGGDASGSAGPVNLNTATADQLDALPGIGPVLAQRIIDWRSAHGSFTSVRDLDQVSGIGDAIYAELEPLVTV